MKKLLIIIICFGFVLGGCYVPKTAYEVTRYTFQDEFSTYFEAPSMNRCKLALNTVTGEFKLWMPTPPSGVYVVNESGDKFRLHYENSLEDEERYLVLTKKYLTDHVKSGLLFTQGNKEYRLPGFYVEGFLNRIPAWVQ